MEPIRPASVVYMATAMPSLIRPIEDFIATLDRQSTRPNSSHTDIYPLSLHDALPILLNTDEDGADQAGQRRVHGHRHAVAHQAHRGFHRDLRSAKHTSELQSHRYLPSFPTRRSSDLIEYGRGWSRSGRPASCTWPPPCRRSSGPSRISSRP